MEQKITRKVYCQKMILVSETQYTKRAVRREWVSESGIFTLIEYVEGTVSKNAGPNIDVGNSGNGSDSGSDQRPGAS